MTRRPAVAVFLFSATLAACSRVPPERHVVDDAARALGGAERILALKTIVIQGGGTQYNLGQDLTPGASGQTFTVTNYRRSIDLVGRRARTELTRAPNFTYFQGPAPQRQVVGIDSAVAYNIAANGAATRAADPASSDRKAELLHHPIAAIRTALDPSAKLTSLRTEGGQSLVDVITADGQSFTLAVDETTKLPSMVRTMADNTNLGDVAISTAFADYRDVGDLKLPARLTTKTDDFTTAEVVVMSQTVDGDTGDLAAPAVAVSAPVGAPPPPTVTAVELAKGVWHLAGGSHHSVLVEFADHLMLIEAPQNDARALAVIARARELRPDKPLTQLVNSHHHFDHSGGVRAAISEGLTIITHQGNTAFYEQMAKRPHTIAPDALGRNAKALSVEGVGDEKTITDGQMTVSLYPLIGAHSETMLMAYLPRERILVEADVYSPGGAVQVYSGKFLQDLKARNLRIDRIAPLHSTVAPFAQLVQEAGAP